MKTPALLLAACLLLPAAAPSFAGEPAEAAKLVMIASRPDGQAPIGVMGNHMHMSGTIMFSYRYMRMEMEGSKDGTDDLSTDEVLALFPVAPLSMTVEMHMFGGMYAPTDWVTVMLMVPLAEKEMDHITGAGVEFTTESSGIGDVGLSGLIQVYHDPVHDIHLNMGLTLPSGSVNKHDDTPAQANAVLPYPMQLGSGTIDLRPGVTYTGFLDQWSWGGQFLSTIRLGENSEDYTLGDRFFLTGWGAAKWADWFSTSVRLAGQTWGDIEGRDIRLNSNQVQTADQSLQAGSRLDFSAGVNLLFPEATGVLADNRIAIEFGFPIYQSLDGPQLETDWSLTVGWQRAF